MAKTIVDATGRMRTIIEARKQQVEKQYDSMEEALRKGEIHFTKKALAQTYGLTTPEVWGFIKLMRTRSVLGIDPTPPKLTKGWREESWYIVDRPRPWALPPPRGPGQGPFPGKTQSDSERRRMSGTHLCDRCGSIIPGTGRHRKSSRGHTRDVCDLAMVKVIHDS